MNTHNNNNNNNNNNEYNNKLYNSVFNNKYLKRIIFSYLNKYNLLYYNNIEFDSYEDWEEFKYKEYLNSVSLFFYYNFSELPENIKNIRIRFYENRIKEVINEERTIPEVPNHIESVEVFLSIQKLDQQILDSFISKLSNETLLSKFKSLNIINPNNITINSIPDSVSKLYIQRLHELKKNLLPNNLKEANISNIKSFEDGCFPESIISSSLQGCSNPLIINQFSLNGLVKLEFTCRTHIGNNIRFPNSLLNLIIECNTFNAILPHALKSLELSLDIYKYEVVFPSSLETLKVECKNVDSIEPIQSKFSVQNNNFVTFELSITCSSIVDNNGKSILPDRLTKLEIYGTFNEELRVNQLPSTLTYLLLAQSYNQIIDIDVLPSNLKTLVLDTEYSQIINPLAIPNQLELLEINNYQYQHPINLTSSTHPNLVIKCPNLEVYYNESNTSVRKLQLPENFNSSLSTLQLQDKSSLEYLHFGYHFNNPIELSDLPIINNIKILELNLYFNHTINLEFFQNLETIILPDFTINNKTLISTTINHQDGSYNFYNLKNIIVQPMGYNSYRIFNSIDINFYQFIKKKQ